jgi:hypothetical protein
LSQLFVAHHPQHARPPAAPHPSQARGAYRLRFQLLCSAQALRYAPAAHTTSPQDKCCAQIHSNKDDLQKWSKKRKKKKKKRRREEKKKREKKRSSLVRPPKAKTNPQRESFSPKRPNKRRPQLMNLNVGTLQQVPTLKPIIIKVLGSPNQVTLNHHFSPTNLKVPTSKHFQSIHSQTLPYCQPTKTFSLQKSIAP